MRSEIKYYFVKPSKRVMRIKSGRKNSSFSGGKMISHQKGHFQNVKPSKVLGC